MPLRVRRAPGLIHSIRIYLRRFWRLGLRGRRKRFRNLKAIYDALPYGFGFLEIDKQTEGKAGSSQLVDALRDVFVGEAADTFQFLALGSDSTKGEFFKKRAFVDLPAPMVLLSPIGFHQPRPIDRMLW